MSRRHPITARLTLAIFVLANHRLAMELAFPIELAAQTPRAAQEFAAVHKLGPGDELAVQVEKHPDYSTEVAVSAGGTVLYPLIGQVDVAGLTVTEAQDRFAARFAEYLVSPRVHVSLAGIHSQRISVLGDVARPGVIAVKGPMRVLDAIAEAGGVREDGSLRNVTILRQEPGGAFQTFKVDAKRILEGKATQAENLAVEPGDTIVVHGGLKKWLPLAGSITGIATFILYLTGR
jgi:polysaccharide export outer membrane protein